MKWTNQIRLTYSTFVREARSVENDFDDLLTEVRKFGSQAVVETKPSVTVAVTHESLPRFKDKAVLVFPHEDEPLNLLVRSWDIIIYVPEPACPQTKVDNILSQVGEKFTHIVIERVAFTDVEIQ